MDFTHHLKEFKKAAEALDKKVFERKQIEVAAGIVMDAVFLKLYKKKWATPSTDPLTATSRIFFSVWVTDAGIKAQKIYYNIHALKLRQLTGYTIESRKFAAAFRDAFKTYQHDWPNVSTQYGPATLMEGWISIDTENYEDQVTGLANNFLQIEHLIDQTLLQFRK